MHSLYQFDVKTMVVILGSVNLLLYPISSPELASYKPGTGPSRGGVARVVTRGPVALEGP